MDQESDKIERLEDRIQQLEATTKKMMPTRRDALKYGGAAAIGAAAMSGTASAGSAQVGTIGDSSNRVDLNSEDIDNSDTITTQDLVVNGTATGPFGGGGVILEAGDTITVAKINRDSTSGSFITLYNGTAKDVLGGIYTGGQNLDFLYTFSDSSTLRKNGSGTSYTGNNRSDFADRSGGIVEIDFLPPAKDVTKIEVGATQFGADTGAEVILKD